MDLALDNISAVENFAEDTDLSFLQDVDSEPVAEEESSLDSDAVPVPKKRGRNPKPKSDGELKEPKKRGRKKKEIPPLEPDLYYESLQELFCEFEKRTAVLNISDITIPDWKSESRQDSRGGLKDSVEKIGLLNPISVFELPVDDYEDFDEEDSESETETRFILLDGYRRILALQALGIETVECTIWYQKADSELDFGEDLSTCLDIFALNAQKVQRRTNRENWVLASMLEGYNVKPETIDSLLNLPLGSSTQLKDVMLADDEFMDVRDKMVNGDLTIEAASKKLASARKKAEKERLLREQGDLDGVSADMSEGKSKGKKGKKAAADDGFDMEDDSFESGSSSALDRGACRVGADGELDTEDCADHDADFVPMNSLSVSPEYKELAQEGIANLLKSLIPGETDESDPLYQNAVLATAQLIAGLSGEESVSEPSNVEFEAESVSSGVAFADDENDEDFEVYEDEEDVNF